MGAPELSCPVCDADLILAGDERAGDLVHCMFCAAPFRLREQPRAGKQASWKLEEDF